MPRAEQSRGLGRIGGRILDRLRFVEDRVIERDVLKNGGIAAQRAVRRDDQVVLVEVLFVCLAIARDAAVIEQLQIWGDRVGAPVIKF